MKIHKLKIEGFKSIGSITLTEPNPFSVFVGPNAAGKSNIFGGLEFLSLCNKMSPNGAKEFLQRFRIKVGNGLKKSLGNKISFAILSHSDFIYWAIYLVLSNLLFTFRNRLVGGVNL